MITTLELTKFMGKTGMYEFKDNDTVIHGKNGCGKSRIKEALCFVLTGMDSRGAKRLPHLISSGENKCSVSIDDGSTRTLQNQSKIDFRPGGGSWGRVITSNDSETLLAAISPGFFMSCDNSRRVQILKSIMTPVDRFGLFEKISGLSMFSLGNDICLTGKLSVALKQARVKKATVLDRLDEISVRVEVIRGKERPTPVPSEFPKETELDLMQSVHICLKIQHEKKESVRRTHEKHSNAKNYNQQIADQQEKLKAEINAIKYTPVPEYDESLFSKIQELILKKMPEPAFPKLQKVPDQPYCSTCGQAVPARLRESVLRANEAEKSKYEEELSNVRLHNLEIEKKLKALREEHNLIKIKIATAQKENDVAQRRKASLMKELAELKPIPVPIPGHEDDTEEPIDISAYDYSESKYQALVEEKQNHVRLYNIYLMQEGIYQKEQKELAKLLEERTSLLKKEEELLKIELALKELPKQELAIRLNRLKLSNGVTVIVNDEVNVYLNGVPYDMLSTGQKMQTDIEISHAINRALEIPPNLIIIDNADLISNISIDPTVHTIRLNVSQEEELCVQ